MTQTELASALLAGSCLIDSSSTPQNHLKGALYGRLLKYYDAIGATSTLHDTCTLQEVQIWTARESLGVVERVQRLVNVDVGTESQSTNAGQPPLLGVRDLAQLRTLISIVFRWGTEPLLSNVVSAWTERSATTPNPSKIIDLTSTPEDYRHLRDLTSRVLALIFPAGPQQRSSNTLITETLLNRYLKEILEPSIALGWLPKSLASDSMLPFDDARPLVIRLLSTLPASHNITSLGGVMSARSSVPHIRRACGYLLSRQLMRPDGVKGLCAAVFGEAEGDDVQLEQLEHIARVVSSVPANMKPQDYFTAIIPRLIGLLHEEKLKNYRRAAAFTLSRLLTGSDSAAREIILSTLHAPFLHPKFPGTPQEQKDSQPLPNPIFTMSILLANSDPLPELISTLLAPIMAPLYALLYHLDSSKVTDPTVREVVWDMMITWFRVSSVTEAVAVLLFILNDQNGRLRIGFDGEIERLEKAKDPVSLFTPESLKNAEEAGEFDLGANWLDMYPDPTHYVGFLQSVKREDIVSDLFVVVLEAYRANKKEDGDPIQTLRYLQVIVQMQSTMSQDSKLGGFKKPIQILSFIKQVLEDAAITRSTPQEKDERPSNIPRLVAQMTLGNEPQTVGETDSDADSDDDMPDSEKRDIDTEMTETALNILLAVLEGNKNFSTQTAPVLNDILLLIEPFLTGDSPSGIKELAREARLVLTARLALQNMVPQSEEESPEQDARQTYQQALKFLQDPILPLRAHGLLLLRQLVSEQSKSLDPALIPAIRDIFMQSVQDNDSYIFLNAVQGLAALVDRSGESVLRQMLDAYGRGLDGLGGSSMSHQDVDIRLRLGEAIGAVIRRCGTALGAHGNVIVPSMLRILRSKNAPTTLKTSSLSLLADCQSTYPLVLSPFFLELSDGILDLLQLEGRTTETETAIDDDPTSKNSKFPPLRRAALHFLSLLLKGTIENIYDTSSGRTIFSQDLIRRTKIILSYAGETDGDTVVRVMAREALELTKELELAIVDISAVG
ncbi:hypothetical protein V5O48_002462 [Marasmius crinis-equi]|uniref:RNA polymerase II assembly factor Rtp1 C-terminal domain-containing protein n=1 Tax=Marasmius crinis-equi TaxID=585013 RepID=A0ABR3FVP1_9AGAR